MARGNSTRTGLLVLAVLATLCAAALGDYTVGYGGFNAPPVKGPIYVGLSYTLKGPHDKKTGNIDPKISAQFVSLRVKAGAFAKKMIDADPKTKGLVLSYVYYPTGFPGGAYVKTPGLTWSDAAGLLVFKNADGYAAWNKYIVMAPEFKVSNALIDSSQRAYSLYNKNLKV